MAFKASPICINQPHGKIPAHIVPVPVDHPCDLMTLSELAERLGIVNTEYMDMDMVITDIHPCPSFYKIGNKCEWIVTAALHVKHRMAPPTVTFYLDRRSADGKLEICFAG